MPVSQQAVKLFTHAKVPVWGRGLLVGKRDGRLVLHWEDGKEHLVALSHEAMLLPCALPPDEAVAVEAKITNLRAPRPRGVGGARTPKPRAATTSFEEQLRRFEILFPGGFTGERYLTSERGADGVENTGKDRYKQGGVFLAQKLLGEGAFGDVETVFTNAGAVLGATNLVFAVEGAIPYRGMKPEHRAPFAEALRALLHGAGDYSDRFDQFVASIMLADSKGKARQPTWPLTTLFPALLRPSEHLLLLLAELGRLLGLLEGEVLGLLPRLLALRPGALGRHVLKGLRHFGLLFGERVSP